MNLNQLYYFRTVARLQHFTKAAEELNISQPSLSYAISSMEEELQAYLFEKQGRNVNLTKYGKVFLEYVERSLEELEFGIKYLKKLTSSTEGFVDIAYVYPLAPRYIPKMVRRFLDVEGNEGISFAFFEGITSTLIEGLKSQKYDVVFGSKMEKELDIEYIPVIDQELKVIVPSGHPLEKRKSVDLKELEEYPLIVYNKVTGLGQLTDKIFSEHMIVPHSVSSADTEQALYGLVEQGFGIALAVDIPEMKNYKIKAVKIKGDATKRHIYMAHLKNQYLSPSVLKFISYVKEHPMEI